MNPELLLRNLLAFTLQTSVVAAIGAALPWLLRLEVPKLLLRYWQLLLLLSLLAPAAQYLAVPAPAQSAVDAAIPLFFASAGFQSLAARSPFAVWILWTLAAGILLRLAWLTLGLCRLAQYRRRAEAVHVPSAGTAQVKLSGDIAGPVSFGIFRPVILLPHAWRSLPPEQQHLVILHELSHLRRNDWPFHLAEELIRAAFWFHPAFWFVIRQIRTVREQVVDRAVVGETRSPEAYIEALLASADAELHQPSFRLPAPCFARKHELVERIRKLKKEYLMSKLRTAVSFAGVALVLLAGGWAASWSFPLQAAQAGSSGKVYRMGDGVTPPRVLSKVDPDYTEDARDAKIQGTVLLALEITPEGVPQNVQVKKSLEPGLDRKAVESIYQWRFSPGVKDGELVTVAANIEVNFRLK